MVQRRTPALPSKRWMPASSAASLISFSASLLGLTLTAPRVLLAGPSPWGVGVSRTVSWSRGSSRLESPGSVGEERVKGLGPGGL